MNILLNKENTNSLFLNKIIGTILNSTNKKLSKTTSQGIFSKFNQLVGEIKNKTSLIAKEGRSRRSEPESGHFTKEFYDKISTYNREINDKKINIIIDQLDKIIQASIENFEKIDEPSKSTKFEMLVVQFILLINNQPPEIVEILLHVFEITVKTLFTEDLYGLFISLDYINLTNDELTKKQEGLINDQIDKMRKQIENYRKIFDLKQTFDRFMRDKKGTIFTPEKITESIGIRPFQSAQAVLQSNIPKNIENISPLHNAQLFQESNQPSPEINTQISVDDKITPINRKENIQNPIISVPGPFGPTTSPLLSANEITIDDPRLIELQQKNNQLRNEIQEKDNEIINLKEDIERLEKKTGIKRESELILESQSPRYSKTDDSEEGKSQIKGGNGGSNNPNHKITFKNRRTKK